MADIENNTAKELTKLGAVIQVPFRSGNQFMGEGGLQVRSYYYIIWNYMLKGLQDVFYGIRDKTRIIADQHANLGRTVDSSIVQHLQKLRTEIKAHIKVRFAPAVLYQALTLDIYRISRTTREDLRRAWPKNASCRASSSASCPPTSPSSRTRRSM